MNASRAVGFCAIFVLLGGATSNGESLETRRGVAELKKPIDTWENIHTFLVFDYYVTEQEFPLLSRYDFIWGAATYVHTHNPPISPKMIVTDYITGDRDFNALNVDHNLAWYQQNHPDWVVYGCDQKTPAYEFGQTAGRPGERDLIPIDISNPDVVAFQADVYGQRSADHGEDGLGADNISLQNVIASPARCKIFRNGKWVQLYSGMQRDPEFAIDVVNWAHELRRRLHRLSPPQSLIVNLAAIDFLQPQEPFLHRFFQEVDGILEEGGFVDLSDNDWVHKIQLIRDIQHLGLPYYGINEYGVQANHYTCTDATVVPVDRLEWSIASYLMAKEHSAALYISHTQEYGCALWYPEYEAKVGHPCGEMYKAQSVYLRYHSKALSIVNPSSTATHQVNLPARQFVDLHGNVVSSPITAPPHSGYVLLITGKPDFCQ